MTARTDSDRLDFIDRTRPYLHHSHGIDPDFEFVVSFDAYDEGRGETIRAAIDAAMDAEPEYQRPAYTVTESFIALPPITTDRETGIVTGLDESMAALREHMEQQRAPHPEEDAP